MGASVESPDGGGAVERQGGAADALDRAAGVTAQAQARLPDAGRRALRGEAGADLGARDPEWARVPLLQLARAQRYVQADQVLERPALALLELAAARRIPGERVGPRDPRPGRRQLRMEAAEERGDVFHGPLGQARKLLGTAGAEPGDLAARDLLHARRGRRPAERVDAARRLDAPGDSRRGAERRGSGVE